MQVVCITQYNADYLMLSQIVLPFVIIIKTIFFSNLDF